MRWILKPRSTPTQALVAQLKTMQKHTLSDEVFVLLKGECFLFTAGGGERPGEIQATVLKPYKCYNVKKGVWHTHTLTDGSSVLIVENRNTGDDNSPTVRLTEEMCNQLLVCYNEIEQK